MTRATTSFLGLFVAALAAGCGSRSQLIVPPADHADVIDGTDTVPPDVPITAPCSWPPIAEAVRLSDGTESWALGDAIVGDEAVYAAWFPLPSGAVWMTRVGFGGERIDDPHSSGGLFAAYRGWLHLSRAGTGVAAFTSWMDIGMFETLAADARLVTSFVEHRDWPEIMSVVERGAGFDAFAFQGTRTEQLALGATGDITDRQTLTIDGGAAANATRAVSPDGSFAALWSVTDSSGSVSLRARVFDPMGQPVADELQLASRGATTLRAIARVDDGYLATWVTDATSTDGAAMSSALIGFDGAESVRNRVRTEGVVPDSNANLALTGAAHGAIAAFATMEGRSRRLVLLPLSADGHATRPPQRLRTFAQLTRIVALETRDGAVLVVNGSESDRPARLAVWSMGFTCLR